MPLRTVIFEDQARQVIEDLYEGAELADAACRSFDFVLAHNPESGTHIEEDVWMIEMRAAGVWKKMVLFYSFDADTVTIHDVIV